MSRVEFDAYLRVYIYFFLRVINPETNQVRQLDDYKSCLKFETIWLIMGGRPSHGLKIKRTGQ